MGIKMKNKCVFWDRDGVINYPVIINNVSHPPDCVEHLRLVFGIRQLMDKICKMGFLNIVFTNQPDWKRKLQTKEDIEKINNAIIEYLPLDDLFTCFHDNYDNCECRKPKPGMLLEAQKKYSIDFSHSWVVGDMPTDIEAGKAVGCKTILVDNGFKFSKPCSPDYIVKSIEEIEDIIYNDY
jgi:D-glycero-D-manno-heptose 1,7-bisphosphate phosphatase